MTCLRELETMETEIQTKHVGRWHCVYDSLYGVCTLDLM